MKDDLEKIKEILINQILNINLFNLILKILKIKLIKVILKLNFQIWLIFIIHFNS